MSNLEISEKNKKTRHGICDLGLGLLLDYSKKYIMIYMPFIFPIRYHFTFHDDQTSCLTFYALSTLALIMGEKFCLRWNDFQSNVIRTFSSIRNEENFHDVTLVSSEGRQVSAHKVVLTSCSDYFKTILTSSRNRVGSMILCLENIKIDELNNMLD